MSPGLFFYVIPVALCAGIAVAIFLGWGTAAGLILLVFALAAVMLGRKKEFALIAAAALAAAALGFVRVDLMRYAESRETLVHYLDRTAVIEGSIANDPERRDTSLRAAVAVSSINAKSGSGTLLVQLPRDTELTYGERVRVRGLLVEPQPFETAGGRIFDYPAYLRVRGISAVMPHASLQDSEPGDWSVQGWLYALKHSFESSIERVFPEPDGSLLEGILLGERRGLPQDLSDAFIRSSLIHVVVLSGYNISIISTAVLSLLGFLSTGAALGTGAVLMVLFALLTGAGAATVRALIMALIAVLARYLGRPTAALRALAVAAAGMALWNPLSLVADPSFILSVLATFGLITLSPAIESRLGFLPNFKRFESRSIAASTIAVQIYVLPALLYFTGIFSVVALPANLLALPVVSLAMGFGFAAGLLGLAHPLLALVPALPAELFLRWMMYIARVAASLPLSSFVVPAFPAWLAVAVYIPLTHGALRAYGKAASRLERDAAIARASTTEAPRSASLSRSSSRS